MGNKILLFIGLIFISSNAGLAQNRVVTNEDLEKYRQKRVAAERDLRENYERLGFPSPAEMQKQIERNQAERSALSARLELENQQRERLNLERQRAESETRRRSPQYQANTIQRFDDNYSNFGLNGYYGFSSFGYRNYRLNLGYRNGYGGGYYGNYSNQPRIEYRNNLPVVVQPPPPPIFAPR